MKKIIKIYLLLNPFMHRNVVLVGFLNFEKFYLRFDGDALDENRKEDNTNGGR